LEAVRRDIIGKLQEISLHSPDLGTENYVIKHGSPLWIISQQRADLPVWLVPSTTPMLICRCSTRTVIALPRVEGINPSDAAECR